MALIRFFLKICFLVLLSQSSFCARNPFEFAREKTSSQARNRLYVEGAVHSGARGGSALFCLGQDREIVAVGESFCGYRLVEVFNDYVVVEKNNVKQIVQIE